MKLDELLIQYGYTRPFTQVLIYCTRHKDDVIRLHDIERATDLRQPEVSVAMKTLVELGWVEMKVMPPIGELGYPGKSYRLIVTPYWIAEYIATKIYDRIKLDEKLAKDIRIAMTG